MPHLDAPATLEVALVAAGWLVGWVLLWHRRPLPSAAAAERRHDAHRPAVAVVVPARNESEALGHLLPPLLAGLRPGDELVVVDDHSTDDTAAVARSLGARVEVPPALPDGWRGKPHACAHGAAATQAPTLLFVDADVRPPVDLVDRIAVAVAGDPGAVVSVQPWHVVERPSEHLSLLCNVAALMGVGTFALGASGRTAHAAFGPVLAIDRATYDRIGGHAHPDVRARHTEDIGIARQAGRAALHGGRPDITFRMYPGGWRELWSGWGRSIATGAGAGPWWAVLGTVAWITSLAGGWLAVPWTYPFAAVQVWVLGRRAGRFSPLLALAYPVAVAAFVAVFARSLALRLLGRDVSWKGRRVPAR